MTIGFFLASCVGAYAAGMLCWKLTRPWRDAVWPDRPAIPGQYRPSNRVDMIAFWLSFGAALVGMFVTEGILIWMGFN
jgi:hypothetical protein